MQHSARLDATRGRRVRGMAKCRLKRAAVAWGSREGLASQGKKESFLHDCSLLFPHLPSKKISSKLSTLSF